MKTVSQKLEGWGIDKSLLTAFIALVVVIMGFVMGDYLKPIIYILNFVIALEVVRIAVEYITSETHRIKIRYAIDTVLFFDLREILIFLADKHDIMQHLGIAIIYIAILFIMLLARFISMKISPSEMEECHKE